MAGCLYIVPTPIGNLEDMTLRAIRMLRESDLILAEDTRTSKKLLDHYDITTPLRSYHIHNEHALIPNLIQDLKAGSTMSLVSDAGMPSISDPGFLLVRACREENILVSCLPGPSAFLTALVASGLPADRFFFQGFLPHKKGRQTKLIELAALPYTFVLYESPHRLVKCLEQLIEHCGTDRPAAIGRELTKVHEEVISTTLGELASTFQERKVRGEFVIVVGGKTY